MASGGGIQKSSGGVGSALPPANTCEGFSSAALDSALSVGGSHNLPASPPLYGMSGRLLSDTAVKISRLQVTRHAEQLAW